MTPPDTTDNARRLASGDRRALSRAITLTESTRTDHRRAARELIGNLPPRSRPRVTTPRI